MPAAHSLTSARDGGSGGRRERKKEAEGVRERKEKVEGVRERKEGAEG